MKLAGVHTPRIPRLSEPNVMKLAGVHTPRIPRLSEPNVMKLAGVHTPRIPRLSEASVLSWQACILRESHTCRSRTSGRRAYSANPTLVGSERLKLAGVHTPRIPRLSEPNIMRLAGVHTPRSPRCSEPNVIISRIQPTTASTDSTTISCPAAYLHVHCVSLILCV